MSLAEPPASALAVLIPPLGADARAARRLAARPPGRLGHVLAWDVAVPRGGGQHSG